jgi:hypothetical protein
VPLNFCYVSRVFFARWLEVIERVSFNILLITRFSLRSHANRCGRDVCSSTCSASSLYGTVPDSPIETGELLSSWGYLTSESSSFISPMLISVHTLMTINFETENFVEHRKAQAKLFQVYDRSGPLPNPVNTFPSCSFF